MTPDMTPDQMLEILTGQQRQMRRLVLANAVSIIMCALIVVVGGYFTLHVGSLFVRAANLAASCINFSNLEKGIRQLLFCRRVQREMAEVRDVLELERLAKL
jgi:hypothetical protein